MVKAALVAIIGFCTKYAYATIAASVFISAVATYYSAGHFAINTDVSTLISEDLPWRQREVKFEKSMPNRYENILVVVEAPTPELATLARTALADELANDKDLFPSIVQPGATPFFTQNGLLFRSKDEVATFTKHLATAGPLIRLPVTDPNLRGVNQMILLALAGVSEHQLMLDTLAQPFDKAATAVRHRLPAICAGSSTSSRNLTSPRWSLASGRPTRSAPPPRSSIWPRAFRPTSV
jgi:uncharacterized protein